MNMNAAYVTSGGGLALSHCSLSYSDRLSFLLAVQWNI